MHLTQDQIHIIAEALLRQRRACYGFKAEMDSIGQTGLANQFQWQANQAAALLAIFEDAESVVIEPLDYDESKPENGGQA